jgi:hypothetical protein
MQRSSGLSSVVKVVVGVVVARSMSGLIPARVVAVVVADR